MARPDDAYSRATILDTVACLEQATGRYEGAVHLYRQAIDLYGDVGHDLYRAGSLNRLGETLLTLDRGEEARTCWERALDIFRAHYCVAEAADVGRRLDTAANVSRA